ncbi:hypothetical protein Ahy_A08g039786 [Arachis hypogaea]|uniref:Uncharacterized protein n=1 Tax=Arachis hypogaea TaxID=3818 RepID=A0A445BXJ1_ARAHY|nr:hypothetical protein Ahy_A08g039786 [Arachis hypogaea]
MELSAKEYVVDSNDSDSEDDENEEFVLETSVEPSRWYLLSVPYSMSTLSSVPSHYHTLDLDAMQEKNLFFNTGEDDYNLDDDMEFRVGHRFKSRDAVMHGVKNYSIRRSVEYRVVESDRLNYHTSAGVAPEAMTPALHEYRDYEVVKYEISEKYYITEANLLQVEDNSVHWNKCVTHLSKEKQMKKSGLFAASVAAAASAAVSSSNHHQDGMAERGRQPSSSTKANSSSSEKFAPRFDGLRFIETLVTAHR